MTGLPALWLPILLSSVIVFVASSIIHMLLPWHKSDYPKVPNEDRVSPLFPAMFSFQMLGSTPQGEAYTASEFEDMGRAAGFKNMTVKLLPPTPQSLILLEKA